MSNRRITIGAERATPHIFSVIVPAYNASATIERCAGSVLNQTCQDLELIIVDDDSSDETYGIVQGIRDPRLTLLRSQQNEGPSKCRNRALDRAKGKFVVFVDADDWVAPSFLADSLALLQIEGDPDLLVTRYYLFTSTGIAIDRQNYVEGDPLRAFLEDRITSAVWAKVFKRSIIQAHLLRFPDVRYMEDSVFMVSYLKHARSAFLLDKPLYNFDRTRESSTSKVFSPTMIDAAEQALVLTHRAIGDHGLEYEDSFFVREFRMIAMHSIRELARQGMANHRLAIIRDVRLRLWQRFGLRIVRDRRLRLTEKWTYLSWLVFPRISLRLLGLYLRRRPVS